jgi:hypothetical protein
MSRRRASWESRVYIAQGLWYLLPGLWSLLARDHYRRVHRLTSDYWIDRAHALWLTLVGAVLTSAGLRQQVTFEIRLLGFGTAAGLSGVTGLVQRREGVARVYVLDLLGELAFAGMLLATWWLRRTRSGRFGRHPTPSLVRVPTRRRAGRRALRNRASLILRR